jgi:hypothetical protein
MANITGRRRRVTRCDISDCVIARPATWRIGNWPDRDEALMVVEVTAEVVQDETTLLQSFRVAVPATLRNLDDIEREAYRRVRPILASLAQALPPDARA